MTVSKVVLAVVLVALLLGAAECQKGKKRSMSISKQQGLKQLLYYIEDLGYLSS